MTIFRKMFTFFSRKKERLYGIEMLPVVDQTSIPCASIKKRPYSYIHSIALSRIHSVHQIPSDPSNWNKRPSNSIVNTILLHDPGFHDATNSDNDHRLRSLSKERKLQITIDELTLPNKKKSAHYTLDYDGTLYQHVRIIDQAWHAGESQLFGKSSVNAFSIGIEVLHPYEDIQYLVLALLIDECKKTFPEIKPPRIVGHKHVSPGRKIDPIEFDFEKLYFHIYSGKKFHQL